MSTHALRALAALVLLELAVVALLMTGPLRLPVTASLVLLLAALLTWPRGRR